jgi:general secretion pathway protein G
MRRSASRARGLTLIEMLVTLALVAVAASIVLPLASIAETRAKEAELRRNLRTIRTALDNYKAAADSGLIDKPTGASGYPPSLDVLAQGVARSSAAGAGAPPIVFLRRVPRDPFAADRTNPPSQSWNIRAYGNASEERPRDVFDITSKSDRTALDGTRYSDW